MGIACGVDSGSYATLAVEVKSMAAMALAQHLHRGPVTPNDAQSARAVAATNAGFFTSACAPDGLLRVSGTTIAAAKGSQHAIGLLADGSAVWEDVELLRSVAAQIRGKCLCALGDFSTMAVTSALERFPEDFKVKA